MDVQQFIELCNARLERVDERRQQRQPAPRKQPAKCGAFARSTGNSCQKKALANGRCRNHGGVEYGAEDAGGEGKGSGEPKTKQD